MNTSITMQKTRAQQQIAAGSLKSKKISAGEVLEFEQLVPGDFTNSRGDKVPNDQIICVKQDGKRVKVPVREYLKMNTSGEDSKLYKTNNESDEVKFPTSITITSSKDRLDRDGNNILPVFAYEKAEEFLAEGSNMTWSELVKAGEKKEHSFDIVQDYTISTNY